MSLYMGFNLCGKRIYVEEKPDKKIQSNSLQYQTKFTKMLPSIEKCFCISTVMNKFS